MAVIQQETSSTVDQFPDYIPVRMLEVELGQPLPTITAFNEKNGKCYQRARCLVRLHTQPLGLVDLKIDKEELSPDEYAPKIWQELNQQINEHLQQDGLPPITEIKADGLFYSNLPHCIDERDKFLADAPFVSVIIPTHDRPDRLALCLDSLLSLHYPQYEIIVVDNTPSTNATADLVNRIALNDPKIRYIREDRPGPSWARNCGITIAKGEILAFTDDDVIVDSYWLAELVRGFESAEEVACVTGLVLPLELETSAQFLFEEFGGYTKGFKRLVIDSKANPTNRPMHPYIADRFGTGASMALTAAFIRRIGGFDPALGHIGPVRCSQDIAIFFQVLAHGYKLVYEPTSLVYHLHRRTYMDLKKQTYNQAVGYTACLTKSLLSNPWFIFDFAVKLPYALFFTFRSRLSRDQKERPQASQVIHKELIALRRKGLLYGSLAYARSRWEIRKFTTQTLVPDKTPDTQLVGRPIEK